MLFNRYCAHCPARFNYRVHVQAGGVTFCNVGGCIRGFVDTGDGRCMLGHGCSRSTPFLQDGGCVETCADGYYSDRIRMFCLRECPPDMYHLDEQLLCVAQCPAGKYALGRRCADRCQGGMLVDTVNRACVEACPSGLKRHGGTCRRECPPGVFAFGDACVARCPEYAAVDAARMRCTYECEEGQLVVAGSCQPAQRYYDAVYDSIADPSPERFVDFFARMCPEGGYLFDIATQTCAAARGHGSLPHKRIGAKAAVRDCPRQLYDGGLRGCLADCPVETKYLHAPDGRAYCVDECPEYHALDAGARACVARCPPDAPFMTRAGGCAATCPDGTIADAAVMQCRDSCTSRDQYADFGLRRCVDGCERFTLPENRTCHTECPDGYFHDSARMQCVASCPPPLMADPRTRMCQPGCSDGLFTAPGGRCLEACENQQVILLGQRLCQLYCPEGYAQLGSSRVCAKISRIYRDRWMERVVMRTIIWATMGMIALAALCARWQKRGGVTGNLIRKCCS